jgi:hypothetical protein
VPSSASFEPVRESASESSITVSWSPPDTDGGAQITGYRLYINPLDDGDWSLVYDGDGQPTVLVYTVTGLERGKEYRFKSSASNFVGEGSNSTESILLCAATPSAPG